MEIDWNSVERILIVRLRSIGDAVLSTPSITALRNFKPNSKIDILLEDWVAPLYDGFREVDEVISVSQGTVERIKTAIGLRKRKYDLVYNFHGGPTSSLFVRSTGARHRVGFAYHQFGFLNNHRYPDAKLFYNRSEIHSAEQQFALVGYSGVPVTECPATSLAVTATADASISKQLLAIKVPDRFAVIHPAAAYETKRWRAPNFARVVDHLESIGIAAVAVTRSSETPIVERIRAETATPVFGLSGLSLPEVTALTARAEIFIGNDSGIAHIAAAVGTRSVIIFGSSNSEVWKPWTAAPYSVVKYPLDCQPCPGDKCRVFGEPKCILSVTADEVNRQIDQIIEKMKI